MPKESLLKCESSGIILHNPFKEVIPLSEEELYHKLLCAMKQLKLPVDEVSIKIRPYSKTYYGRYFPERHCIFIYPYEDTKGNFMCFTKILSTAVHEMAHHIQHQDPNFKRQKGVMHSPKFWELYNHFIDRAVSLGILSREEVDKVG